MDESFVQGLVGGVLNRHKDKVLDKDRIQTLMVEIAANIDVASQYTNVKGLAKDNPLSIEMWKGWKPTPVEEEGLSPEYLNYWTCDYCNKNTHEIDYDYLSGTNHLECTLKAENLQKKSDKIVEQLDLDFKDYDLSKSESNENSKVDMSAKSSRGKK